MDIQPLGDSAFTFTLDGDDATARVTALARELHRKQITGVIDILPAFESVTVFCDPLVSTMDELQELAFQAVKELPKQLSEQKSSVVEIPVVYGGEGGPDLERLAASANMSVEAFVQLHSSTAYHVLAVGFMPGFAYLGGLPIELQSPRLTTPRLQVPAGSIGIGGTYTGVYPFASPGGWNLIGRTSVKMFDPLLESPALLRVGQTVRFVEVK